MRKSELFINVTNFTAFGNVKAKVFTKNVNRLVLSHLIAFKSKF